MNMRDLQQPAKLQAQKKKEQSFALLTMHMILQKKLK